MPEKNNKYNAAGLSENRLMKYLVRLLVVVVIGAMGIFLYTNMHEKKETDTERGVARLQELEAIDVAETEKTIRGLRGQSTTDEITSNEDLTTSIKGEYLDASILIVGDSAAQLLMDYDVLDESCVIAAIGGGAATSGTNINTAIAMAPENIVLNFGLDDLVYFAGDADEFIEAYESMVQTVKEGLPKSQIYLAQITPVAQDALDMQPEYAHVDEFNTAIKKLSRTMNVKYLETADMVDEYATDGVHPAYSYYVAFAERVLREAGGKTGSAADSAGQGLNTETTDGSSDKKLNAGDGND